MKETLIVNKSTRDVIWFFLGTIGFFAILFAPTLRDGYIVAIILALLGLPAFVPIWHKNGNGVFNKNKRNGDSKVSNGDSKSA